VVNDCQFQGRLVPLNLVDVDPVTAKIRFRCTIAEFGKLDPASRTMLLEVSGANPDVRDQDQLPFSRSVASTHLANPPSVTYDTLPPGEVAVRGREPVNATDGDIGQIQGHVVDSGSHQVTHVLLQEGQMFGRRVVAIPIGAATRVDQEGIQLNITEQQVEDLPSGWHQSPG
jgi:hypothetical protein